MLHIGSKWLHDGVDKESLEQVRLQLAVGALMGYTSVGSETVYLDPSEVDQEALEDMQELLHIGRLLVDYDLKFETDGRQATLAHQPSGQEVRVQMEGTMPFLDEDEHNKLKHIIRSSTAHRLCGNLLQEQQVEQEAVDLREEEQTSQQPGTGETCPNPAVSR